MEKFLGTPSPDRKEVHEVSINSSPLRLTLTLTLNSSDEPGLAIVEIGTVSPAKKSSQQGPENAFPFAEEAVTPELNEEPFVREILKSLTQFVELRLINLLISFIRLNRIMDRLSMKTK